MDISLVILSPVQTEKSILLNELRKYSVVVHPEATKIDIARAIEKIYNRKVSTVRIINTQEKTRVMGKGRTIRKRKSTKKALITLLKGEKAIDFIKTKKSKT